MKKFRKGAQSGFTLLELMLVIAILGILAVIILSSLDDTRAKARDLRRISEIHAVQKSMELYYITFRRYPDGDGDGCGGWDAGNATFPFFNGRGMERYFAGGKPPVDLWKSDVCSGYLYYRYPAGSYGCPAARGPFYILGVSDLEASGSPYAGSPGWSCPGRNWQDEFDWVTGSFEN